MKQIEVDVVIPCLNESKTIKKVVFEASNFLISNNYKGRVIVSDNGSLDNSIRIAEGAGAKTISVQTKGYGAALLNGFNASKAEFIVMGDADLSYDFNTADLMIRELQNGSDLVIGNRFKGGIESKAMPLMNRYIGSPILSFLGRKFFKVKIGDFNCGLRAFNRESIAKIRLETTGMEFASEMIIMASINKLKISETPTVLRKDGRVRRSHLRPWADGWRHLRFMLKTALKYRGRN